MTLDIPDDHRTAVTEFLLAVADDEYFTGHRFGMWLSVSPTLEEDNALTSIAQDELGHARLLYDIVAAERSTTTDDLAIERPAAARRNSVLVERDHADFADAVTRNYLYDEAERLVLESLRDGDVSGTADVAAVALQEEPFHREHAARWIEVLQATAESTERLDRAFRTNVAAARDLFAFPGDWKAALVESGVLARPIGELAADWEATVSRRVDDIDVEMAGRDVRETLGTPPDVDGRAGEHTDDLVALVDEMQPQPIERI